MPPHASAPLGPLDHIGIAVRSLEEAKSFWGGVLGLRLVFEEKVPEEGVRAAGYDGGAVRVELLESIDPDGVIARHVSRRGPGIHHICYRVDDLEAVLRSLHARGIDPVGAAPRRGAGGCQVAFLHPKDTGGVLVELSQPPPGGARHG
jgi:methylmalonyl-CoA epimerase